MSKTKYIIIGAGLSGLTTAYQFLKQGIDDFILLEARDRVGGRILTDKGIDFGATWLQYYHENLKNLLTELEVATFPQHTQGQSVLVYSSMAAPHLFEIDKAQPGSIRIQGGSTTLIEKLAEKLQQKIRLNTVVNTISETEEGISVYTEKEMYEGNKVIVTLPPLLASHLSYSPKLPNKLVQAMQKTHTWMSNAIKVGITFKTPFWRAKGFSGTIIGQVSPVIEMYDHTDYENKQFILKGFVNESLRELSSEERKLKILDYLEKHLGVDIRSYMHYQEKDWSQDMYTSSEKLNSYYLSPKYGNLLFQESYLQGKLFFSGTETALQYGGYLEGAVLSGLNAAKFALENKS
ncbi:flavin monoamine oxidase family protein [Flavicella sediminum]|uniref:flavin monoamine oxidase family protein n=1 Tax=Flavicella sediminum TaxID=2585141 RepID=UPI0011228352|nr:FAD-dependent oxidoreductase [Flavicella sediminum]